MTREMARSGPLTRIAEGLERLSGRPYRVHGGEVLGPGTTSVVIAQHADAVDDDRIAHLDIGFALN